MIEDHTHCSDCGRVCYYPENLKVQEAIEMKLCWKCYSTQRK